MAGLVSADLERRLRAVEDRLAIADLIAGYGPAADSGDADSIRRQWALDGSYTFDRTRLEGDEVPRLVDLDAHRDLMAAGCAHVLSAPRVDLDGDTATAVNHSIVLRHDGAAWAPVRVSANRWELERGEGGWRVRARTNRLLDGSPDAFALFAPLTGAGQ